MNTNTYKHTSLPLPLFRLRFAAVLCLSCYCLPVSAVRSAHTHKHARRQDFRRPRSKDGDRDSVRDFHHWRRGHDDVDVVQRASRRASVDGVGGGVRVRGGPGVHNGNHASAYSWKTGGSHGHHDQHRDLARWLFFFCHACVLLYIGCIVDTTVFVVGYTLRPLGVCVVWLLVCLPKIQLA